jgi:glycosyltransferase involved in cell wall biosynthesis
MTSTLVVVSQRVRRLAIDQERIRTSKIVIIANGIAPVKMISRDSPLLTRFRADLGVQPDDFIFLTVGRLRTQKGHTYLLDAIPEIIRQFPDTVFLLAGDGPLRAELEAKSEALGIQEHVSFLGIRDDIAMLLNLANGFLLPSLWEGMPIALLEAMEAELPVVATQVEGVVEIIQDGVNGMSVPSGEPQALIDAVLRLLRDPQLRQELALAGKKSVEEHYTIGTMCLAYEKLFHKTAGKK